MRTLLLLAFVCGLQQAVCEECEAEVQTENIVNYYNHLIGLTSKRSATLRTRKFEHVTELYKNITKVFDEAGCVDMWDKEFTEEQRDQMTFVAFLKDYKPKNMKPASKELVEVMEQTEDFLWLMMKDHVFASCGATLSRNLMYEWITGKCGKDMFPFTREGLKDFPIPQMYDDKEFESNLRAATTLFGIAFLKAMDCKETKEEHRKLIASIVLKTQEDACYAAIDTIANDACLKDFESKCPDYTDCFEKYILGYQEQAPEAFQGDTSLMTKCLENSKKHWGRERPAEVPKHSKILAAGLRMFRKMTAVKFDDTVVPYMTALMKGIMGPEACDCNPEQLDVE